MTQTKRRERTWLDKINYSQNLVESHIFLQQNQSWLDTLALCGLQGLQRVDQGACHQTQRCHRRHQHGNNLFADIFICSHNVDLDAISISRKIYVFADISLFQIFLLIFPYFKYLLLIFLPLSNICCHLLDVWILFLTVYCYPHSVTRTERAVMQKKKKNMF